MNFVTFPALGIQLHISKIAFSIFGINIAWYAILIVFAIILAFILYKKREGLYKICFSDVFDLGLYVIPISFLCARAYYVLFNLEYYMQNPLEIINIKQGGLAIYGGIIGGAITCYCFAKKRKIAFWDLLDYLVPALALGQAIGRWGNFMNIEAYGIETTNFLRMGIWEQGIYKEVHPTFLYESTVDLLLFFFLFFRQKNRKFSGEITYLYLTFYSLARFFIEGLRIDSLMLGNYRISQILSAIIFVVFCSILAKKEKEAKKTRQVHIKCGKL